MSLDILDVLLLEHLLAYPPLPELVLVGGVLIPVLALAGVRLALELRAISDEVVGVPAPKAILLLSTTPSVHAVVVKPLELVDNQHKLLVAKRLNLLLYDR